MPSTTKVLSLLAAAASVAAHGTVTGIVADGVYYEGYLLDFQYEATEPITVGWLIPEDTDNGFVAPDAYASDDIICHVGATNAMTAAAVSAGGTVEFQWTVWPDSHKGPVITYLANCNGACETVDKTTLEWFKIDAGGLIDDTTLPGTWASDTLIANNNSWTVEIPPTLATGNYVARHEIIALHSAENSDGAQNYPFCVNLAVTGTGSDAPTGVLGTELYTETDAGILVNIYASLATYEIPGPTLWSGAVSVSQTTPAAPTASATGVSSVEAGSGAATTAAASSAAATTAAASSAAVTSAAASSAAATSAAASSPAATSAAASSVAASSSAAVSSAPAVATSAPASTFVTSVAAASSSSGSTACKRKRAAQQL